VAYVKYNLQWMMVRQIAYDGSATVRNAYRNVTVTGTTFPDHAPVTSVRKYQKDLKYIIPFFGSL